MSKETNELIHEKASPFVKWLAEAEEEESSEDEEVEVNIGKDDKFAGKIFKQVKLLQG